MDFEAVHSRNIPLNVALRYEVGVSVKEEVRESGAPAVQKQNVNEETLVRNKPQSSNQCCECKAEIHTMNLQIDARRGSRKIRKNV